MNTLKHFSILAISFLILLGACDTEETEDINIDSITGLIAYYPFDNNVEDNSSNNLNGILGDGIGNNEPDATAGRNGQANSAFEFDGTSKYVDLTENSIFNLGDYQEFSVSIWVDPNLEIEQAQGGFIIGKHISAGNNRMWNLRVLEDKFNFRLYDQGGSALSNFVNGNILEGWQHVAAVLKDNVITLYVNGIAVDSVEKTVTVKADSPTTKTVIGAAHFSNQLFDVNYAGKIDDIRLYNRALNSAEITALANE